MWWFGHLTLNRIRKLVNSILKKDFDLDDFTNAMQRIPGSRRIGDAKKK